ncbi:MAG: serine--tRNA ligase [Deltaproteobacteria bacterium]|jgi:seryl-tRNA synthetase|nr:serine--tRNA ligase [Deltaproteobacteria bacterium]MBK8693230.1 serine--tRNA ligase [Deltaproteobacteria bacterium]MBP6834617.1 serine--tRNA ligase [Deltaproteobacteria bacterium]
MLDLRFVVEHLDEVRASLSRRGAVPPGFERITELAMSRREAIQAGEAKKRAVNEASAGFAKLPKGSPEQLAARAASRALGEEAAGFERAQKAAEAELEDLLLRMPNMADPSVPDGESAEQNVEVRRWGEKPSMAFAPKEHYDLGEALGILDFERATKLSGPRFSVLWGAGAAMERALVQFMLDTHVHDHGYTEVYPPFMVKAEALRGTGNLPKFEADLFKIAGEGERAHDLYLIPTAEVPVTNLHAGEILDDATLPRRYVAFTPCFRSEAGSAGRDTRGLIRQHQFDKVEVVHLERPEESEAAHERLTGAAESILQRLGLHYRVVLLCTGDMSVNSRKTYDIEVWLPGQNAYREISSCSNFGDFQARRAGLKYRPAGDAKAKPRLLHTLNGSALAVGRTLVAIIEQYQQADGSVVVPEVLRPYLRGLERITR